MNLFAIACVLLLEAERYVSAAPCFQQDIGTEANPATSCKNLLRFGQRPSAVYWIKPPGAKAPFQVSTIYGISHVPTEMRTLCALRPTVTWKPREEGGCYSTPTSIAAVIIFLSSGISQLIPTAIRINY